jgi:ZIP family zinc transporter
LPNATLAGAIALALGIGIQNFPEAVAVAVLCGAPVPAFQSFWYGQPRGLSNRLLALSVQSR